MLSRPGFLLKLLGPRTEFSNVPILRYDHYLSLDNKMYKTEQLNFSISRQLCAKTTCAMWM